MRRWADSSKLPAVHNQNRLVAVPDSEGSLSEGVLVQADILARLFGFKLLRLHADVILAPAAMSPQNPVPDTPKWQRTVEAADDRAALVRRTSPPQLRETGDLAEAVRLLGESGRTLDRVRNASHG